MKRVNRIIALMMVMMMFIGSVSYGYDDKEMQYDLSNIQAIMKTILDDYVGDEINKEELVDAAIKGMFDKLDDYSSYYNKEEFKSFQQSLSGDFVGIGAKISTKNKEVFITEPLPDSPALKADLRAKDQILKVDGLDVKDMSFEEVLSHIKGERDTKVILTVKRMGEILDIEIIRDKIEINPITVEDINIDSISDEEKKKIEYLKISDFNSNVYKFFKKTIDEAKENGVKGLIIDLRNNPGGYLDQVVKMCRLVVPKGDIVHTVDKKGNKETISSSFEGKDFEIVVLVNGDSASASEIFASAIQESKAGVLIGETTFGKGVVQKILRDGRGNYFKLTMEEYLTRNENHINKIGVKPNIEVRLPHYIENIDKKFKAGDNAKLIENIEEILVFLGYEIDQVDEKYNEFTSKAISEFQEKNGLCAYGVADFSTQKRLNLELYKKNKKEDVQLNKAYEIMQNMLKK